VVWLACTLPWCPLERGGHCWGCWCSLDTRGELTEDTARRGSGHLPDREGGLETQACRSPWVPTLVIISLFVTLGEQCQAPH
jgi:hypothetical protein